ncbi:MAG: rhomboid family intramembrane serine protease [Phycisphaerales bacterium]
MPLDPPLSDIPRYPVTSLIGIAAAVTTAAWWFAGRLGWMAGTGMPVVDEPWVLLTAVLLHAGVIHLAFNLYWWWRFGTRLERAWGRWWLLALTVVIGVGSSAAESAFSGPGVGLSGVVYGQFALLWVAQRSDPKLAGAVDRKTAQWMCIWFVACIAMTITDVMNVGNVAHGAGAVIGGLLGLAVAPGRRVKWGWLAVTACLLAVVGVAATLGQQWVNLSAVGRSGGYRGYYAMRAQRYEDAARLYKAATAAEPTRGDLYVELGSAQMHLDQMEDAEASFRRAAALDGRQRPNVGPSIAYILCIRARDRAAMKDWAAAEAAVVEALKWDPEDAEAKDLLAWVRKWWVPQRGEEAGEPVGP